MNVQAITGKSKIFAVKTAPTGLLTLLNEEKNGNVARDELQYALQ